MLVVTRKRGQDIYIEYAGKIVIVRVINVCHNKVQLGVNADPDVTIVRGEILNKYPLNNGQTETQAQE